MINTWFSCKSHPGWSQRAPKVSQRMPKGSQRAPKWSQNPSTIHQNGSQNRHERQGRFWMAKMAPKRIQNWAKRLPKSMQNRFKIDAKINAEKVSENEAKMNQNWCRNGAKTDTKFVLFEKWWFCENLVFTIVKARFSRFRGSKNRWEIDPKTMQKHESKKLCKNY